MNRTLSNLLAAVALVALVVVIAHFWRQKPLAKVVPVPKAGPTVTIDAGREPTQRDTSAVSGSGGTEPAVRIVYRDRWRELPAAECADGSAPEADTTAVRVVYVPVDANPLAALPSRPISVSPSRVILTYQEAEGETAGRTVQEVFRVPPRRFGYGVSVVARVPLDSTWSGLDFDRSLAGVVGHLRYQRATMSAGMLATASGDVRPSVGLSVRLWGR